MYENMINFVRKYFKINIVDISILIVLSVIISSIGVLVPYLNGLFVDVLVRKPTIKTIINYSLVIIFVGISGNAITYIFNLLQTKVLNKMVNSSVISTINHLRKISIIRYNRYAPAYLNQRIMNDTTTIFSFVLNNCVALFLNFFIMMIVLYMIFKINSIIAFISVIFIPIYILIYFKLRKPLFKAGMKFKEEQNIFYEKVNEQYQNTEEIKISANFTYWNIILQKLFNNYLINIISYNRIQYTFSSLDNVLALVFQSITLIIGGLEIINNRMSIGEFTMINSYYNLLIQSIKYYFNLGKSIQDSKVAFSRMKELLDIDEEVMGSQCLIQIDDIQLRNLNQSFIHRKDITYSFKKNNIYGILGNNGAGKTSLINTIIGLYNNEMYGSIYINQTEINDINMINTRFEHMAVMTQKMIDSNITVSELFAEVVENCNEEILVQLVEKFQLSEFLFRNNFDLNNYLPRKISDLSGGERQKLLIARTFFKNKNFIILDEPTSNLDKSNVLFLKNYLKMYKYNRIVIIITHDKVLYEIFDEILEL